MSDEQKREMVADLIRPIVMRGFRERLSANQVTDDIIAALAVGEAPEQASGGWRSLSEIPDEPVMVGLWVTNNKTGDRWWETYIISIDDETGEAKSWPEDEHLPWSLQDFDGWQPLPDAPPLTAGE